MASRPSGSPSVQAGEPVLATSVRPARNPAFQVAVARRVPEPLTAPTHALNENVSPGFSMAPERRLTAAPKDGPTEEGTETVKLATGSATPSFVASLVVNAALVFAADLTGTVRAAASAVTPCMNAVVTAGSS